MELRGFEPLTRVDDEQIYDKTQGYGLAHILENIATRV